jgi:hypothetical protein
VQLSAPEVAERQAVERRQLAGDRLDLGDLLLAENGAAWVQLSPSQVEKKDARIKLDPAEAFRFVTLGIRKSRAASIGTAQAPGHVSMNEIELFPVTK